MSVVLLVSLIPWVHFLHGIHPHILYLLLNTGIYVLVTSDFSAPLMLALLLNIFSRHPSYATYAHVRRNDFEPVEVMYLSLL